MNCVLLFIFITLLTSANGSYNPIPIGAVIISTTGQIFVMQPAEYGGTDGLNTIYTADTNMTIVNTVYDPLGRALYILYTNSASGTIYVSKLASLEQLDSTIYQLPITFNVSNINRLNSFTSDIINRRVFLTDETSTMKLFSMSGLLQTTISAPSNITDPIRSVAYANSLNKLYIITDKKINACTNFGTNTLRCCEGIASSNQLRSIAFDQLTGDTYVYVLDQVAGIYQVIFDTSGCPTAFRPINTLGTSFNLYFVIDHGLYFASGSSPNANDNSFLVIANGTATPRSIRIGVPIVALHISYPSTQSSSETEETCFHGITYSNYRAAVVLAAVFGTIMGIFMCFNALFCIDFFMTKRIIRNLKQQIPHNLLEDRWNKLVEEKYAKIALEQQRKKDDPPPRRQSSVAPRKTSSAAAAAATDPGITRDNMDRSDTLQVANRLPRISAYLRRKSEGYMSRRRRPSEEPRSSPRQVVDELPDTRSNARQTPVGTPRIHIESVKEENETQRGLRQNLSRRELIKDDDFL